MTAGVAPSSISFNDPRDPRDPPEGDVTDAGPVKAFRKAGIDAAELAKIFATVPELARIGSDVRSFNAGDVNSIISRSSTPHEGVTFTTSPIFWSPRPGVDLLVATGRGKSMSFVVALWALGGGKYAFASSFLMLHDLSPVALAYDPTHRKELRWTSCWGCPGEQGLVSFRAEERRVVIVQQ